MKKLLVAVVGSLAAAACSQVVNREVELAFAHTVVVVKSAVGMVVAVAEGTLLVVVEHMKGVVVEEVHIDVVVVVGRIVGRDMLGCVLVGVDTVVN